MMISREWDTLFDSITDKSTPMHAAVKANFLHGVLVLLEYDHPVNVTDKAGYTPLHYAAVLPDTTILKT